MFKKIKAGVINMAKQIMENESRIVEARCNVAKKISTDVVHCFDTVAEVCVDIFSNRKNRAVLGIITTGIGFGLIISAYVKLPQ